MHDWVELPKEDVPEIKPCLVYIGRCCGELAGQTQRCGQQRWVDSDATDRERSSVEVSSA
jgi:hypothetical protein